MDKLAINELHEMARALHDKDGTNIVIAGCGDQGLFMSTAMEGRSKDFSRMLSAIVRTMYFMVREQAGKALTKKNTKELASLISDVLMMYNEKDKEGKLFEEVYRG